VAELKAMRALSRPHLDIRVVIQCQGVLALLAELLAPDHALNRHLLLRL
jgi:hypothetical protein